MSETLVSNALIVTINGNDIQMEPELLDVNFESSDNDILDAVEGILAEQNLSMKESDDYTYAVRRATNSGNIYLFPKPVAG